MENLVDMTFGINKNAAIAIAILLDRMQDIPKSDLAIHSYPFYNGREKGIALVAHKTGVWTKATVIVFGENRNSDDIFIDTWQTSNVFDAPIVADFTEEAYKARRYYKFNEHYNVAKGIIDLLSDVVVG